MVDALCLDDLDAFGTELDDPIAELEQDLYHRLIEEPGSNPDDPDRGLGLRRILSGTVDPELKHKIESECLKDDRVDSVQCTITEVDVTNGARKLRADLQIQPAGTIAIELDPVNGDVRRLS